MRNYLLFTLLFLVGCASSSLKINNSNTLFLEHNTLKYTLSTKVQEKQLTHFLNLDVLRYRLLNLSGEELFFEQLSTDINYELKYGNIKTITDIFDVSHYHTVYYSASLLLIQLEVEPQRYVNLLAETSSTKDISYVYGFSDSEFKSLIESLGVQVDWGKMKKGYRVKEPLSSWNQAHLILFPLVEPMFRRGGMF